MKTAAFAPGRVGPLPTYLGYLFLRFPGTLGPEESRTFECLDTYDRRWSRQGQIWIKSETMTLVAPPSVFATPKPPAFGLQKPVVVGRVTLKIRQVSFTSDDGFVEGQLVRFRQQTWLILRGRDQAFDALTAVLAAEGLLPLAQGAGWWVTDKGPHFVPPASWPVLQPEEGAAAALTARLKDGFRVVRQYEKGVKDDIDSECLHQYRVYLRRVRSLASLGRQWEALPAWAHLKELLGKFQANTNELRDLDVLLIDLPGLRAQLPWDEGSNLATWEATIASRRKAEYRKVKTWLESEEYAAAAAEITGLLEVLGHSGEPWTAADLASRAFGRAAQGLRKILKELPADPADELLHEIRIRTKKLRYVLESLGSLGHPGSVKILTAALRDTQDALGKFQDRSILLERLKKGLAGARSGADPLAYGLLVGVIAGDHGRKKAAARADAKTLQSKSVLRALERLVPPPPQAPSVLPGVSDGA